MNKNLELKKIITSLNKTVISGYEGHVNNIINDLDKTEIDPSKTKFIRQLFETPIKQDRLNMLQVCAFANAGLTEFEASDYQLVHYLSRFIYTLLEQIKIINDSIIVKD